MTSERAHEWIEQARARGWGDWLAAALDTLEPFGLLGAQVLYAAQPALGLVLRRDIVDDLAQALETPGGIDELRRLLEADTPASDLPPTPNDGARGEKG